MNEPTYDSDWREKLGHYAPSPTDGDWNAMRALLRDSPVVPRKPSRKWGWWLGSLLLLGGLAGWAAYSPGSAEKLSAFPVRTETGTAAPSPPPAAVAIQTSDTEQPVRSHPDPVTALSAQLPLRVRAAGASEPLPSPRSGDLEPVGLLPTIAPAALPLPAPAAYFDGLPPVEFTPVSRSFYPTPLNLKKRQR